MNAVAHYLVPVTPLTYRKNPICYKYMGNINKFDHCFFCCYHLHLQNIKMWRTNSAGVLSFTLRGKRSHSLLGFINDSLCKLEILRLLLRLCFSASHVVCGFYRGSSCGFFPVFGQGFLCLYFPQEKGWLIFYQGKGQDCLSSPIFPEDWCFCKFPDPDYSKHFSGLSVLLLTSFLKSVVCWVSKLPTV